MYIQDTMQLNNIETGTNFDCTVIAPSKKRYFNYILETYKYVKFSKLFYDKDTLKSVISLKKVKAISFKMPC